MGPVPNICFRSLQINPKARKADGQPALD